MKIKLGKLTAVLLLFLTVFTIYLSISEISGQTACIVNTDDAHANCLTVQNSKYGSIAGVKITYLGTLAIAVLFLLFLLSNSKNKFKQNFYEIYIVGTVVGTLSALYFLSVQFFVLKIVCSSCITVDSTLILISVLSWMNIKIKDSG